MITIKKWVLTTPPVSPRLTCGEVYDLFRADTDLMCVPVVERGIPVGLADRTEVLLQLADHFGRPLFSKKPITVMMDASPLVIDAESDLDSLSRQILAHSPSALLRGFVVVENGKYLGIGTAMGLMNMRLAQEQARARELESLRQAAEQANIAKSNFLATMSHELRTPLNAIIGFSDLILNESFGQIQPARYGEYIQDIRFSGRHLLKLINDILDMAKIEAGQLELQFQPVSAQELCLEAARIIAPDMARAGHGFMQDVPDLPDFWADPRAMRQILLNLLSNAAKFTPAGGHIELIARVEDHHICLIVRDNGIGIAPQDLDTVMRPFGQVESALSRQYNGTGLGLPLVREMTRAMGGTFDLVSQLGQGTTATVRLALRQAAQCSAILQAAG